MHQRLASRLTDDSGTNSDHDPSIQELVWLFFKRNDVSTAAAVYGLGDPIRGTCIVENQRHQKRDTQRC
jgi:hypothetical protein